MKKAFVIAALLATAPAASFANETVNGNWSGFYAGVHVGSADGKLSVGPLSVSDSAAAYGAHLGYNHSLNNNWVLGGEISYSTAEYSIAGLTGDLDTARVKMKVGYDFGSLMAYGILGYVNLDGGGVSEDGVTFGLGLAYKATENVILSGELLRDSTDVLGVDLDVTTLALGLSFQF